MTLGTATDDGDGKAGRAESARARVGAKLDDTGGGSAGSRASSVVTGAEFVRGRARGV